jgi:hypothetical protein
VIFALTALSVFIVIRGEDRGENQSGNSGYTITLRHYGVNAREMERTAAIPLEDALSSIGGIKNIMTTSKNGKVRAFVRFGRKVPGAYEAVREAAQRVYETLPSSAQRTEILSSDDSRFPSGPPRFLAPMMIPPWSSTWSGSLNPPWKPWKGPEKWKFPVPGFLKS